jgi:hypothetical protein
MAGATPAALSLASSMSFPSTCCAARTVENIRGQRIRTIRAEDHPENAPVDARCGNQPRKNAGGTKFAVRAP